MQMWSDLFGAVTVHAVCAKERPYYKGSTARDVSPVIIERVSICLPDCMSNERIFVVSTSLLRRDRFYKFIAFDNL